MTLWRRSSGSSHPAVLAPSALLPEPSFLRALCLERKRAERSQKPIVLMLLEGVMTKGERHPQLLEKTASVVAATIRETDIAGWHTDKRVLGIVFSELGTHDKHSAFTALRARITTALTAPSTATTSTLCMSPFTTSRKTPVMMAQRSHRPLPVPGPAERDAPEKSPAP
jgi:hypothetical protein